MPSSSSRKSYMKFLTLFTEFLGDRSIGFEDITVGLSRDFAIWLSDHGYSQTYINRIGQNFKSLYNAAAKEGMCLKRQDLFPWVTSAKGNPKTTGVHDVTETLTEINREQFPAGSIHSHYRDLLNLSILLGGASLEIVSRMTTNDVSDGKVRLKDKKGNIHTYLASPKIISLITDSRMKIQGKIPLHEDAPPIDHMAALLLTPREKGDGIFSDDSLADAAETLLRRLGFKSDIIKDYLFQPAISSSLSLLDTAPVSQDELDKATEELEDFLFGTRKRWYALKMSAEYKDVVRLIKDFDADESVSVFYPMDKIVCKIRGKVKKISSPVLKNILFISMERSKVVPLDKFLQGKAYFFRTSQDDQTSYSVVRDDEMNRFRELINSDCELIDVSDSRDFANGSEIDITGNIFRGKKAIVIRKEKDGRYLVNVLGSNFRVISTKISKTFLK